MALTTFLIDRARRVYEEQDPTAWDEEGPTFRTLRGPWFRCRLTETEPRQQVPSGRGVYVYLEGDAELLIGVRDTEGGHLADGDGRFTAFDADDKVEVVKKGGSEPGELWELNTRVEPIRKVHGRLQGFKVGLARITEPDVEKA